MGESDIKNSWGSLIDRLRLQNIYNANYIGKSMKTWMPFVKKIIK